MVCVKCANLIDLHCCNKKCIICITITYIIFFVYTNFSNKEYNSIIVLAYIKMPDNESELQLKILFLNFVLVCHMP